MKMAQAVIIGEYKEQYGLLYRYAAEFKLDEGVFMRMYMSFEALKKDFLSSCRPFISVDGFS